MAQTTGAIAESIYKIEVSLNGSSWTDISGQANTVEPSGGDQQTGKQFTANGNVPIVTNSNKTDAVTVKCNIVYTETAGEGFMLVYAQYISTSKVIYLRYSPAGGTTGQKRYVCANAANTAIAVPIIMCLPPKVDAATGDPAMVEFSVLTPQLYQEVVP